MRKLILDAGHTAGKDPGACANGATEHAEMAALATAVAAVLPCLTVPFDLTLPGKIAWVNRQATEHDVLVSLHMNSGPAAASGMQVFFYGSSTESQDHAAALLDTLALQLPLPARGVMADTSSRFGRLGIVRDTKPWAFLVELGFITHAGDLALVRSDGAVAVARALKTWLDRTFQ